MRKFAIIFSLVLFWPGPAGSAPPPELASLAAGQNMVGSASVRLLFWRIFDATLWSKEKTFDWSQPFALTLTYTREFSAKSLAKTTAKEMARLGSDKAGLNEFRDAFRACIDDVIPGDRITALPVSDSEVQFFQNGKDRCTLERPQLKKDFFEIWLGEKSKFPNATAQLLGRETVHSFD